MSNQTIMEGQVIEAGDDLDGDRDQQAELFDLLDEMDAGARAETWISVTRIPMDAEGNPSPNSKSAGQLFSVPLGTMSVSDIVVRSRKFIRAGQHSIMIRVTGTKKGRRGALFHKIFTAERENEEAKAETTGPEGLFKLIQENQRIADERNQQFQERLLSMQSMALTKPLTPVLDPVDSMTKMMTAMGAMMGPMMAVMAGRPMGEPATDPMDSVLKMVTVMQKVGVIGGEPLQEKEESIGDIVKTVASVVGPALQLFAANKQAENMRSANSAPKQLTGPAAPRRRVRAAPVAQAPIEQNAPVDPVAPAAQTPQLTKEQEMELAKLKSSLNTVCDLAAAGNSAKEVAGLVVNSVPQEDDDNFFEMVNDEKFLAQAQMLEPRVGEHSEFFVELRKEILALYEPDTVA